MNEKKFYTTLERPARRQQTFSKEVSQYHLEVKPNGSKVLVEDAKKVNIYDRIQASAVGVDFKEIIKKYQLTGDPALLQQVQGQYGDFTAVTGSLIQMQAQLDNAKTFFESQSLDVRRKYDNDFMKFFAALDAGEVGKEEPKPEVKAAETPGATTVPVSEPTASAVEGVKYE